MSQTHHILIIGGGLAGLALAQALRKLSIESTVFERDADAEGRKQSWAIALQGVVPNLRALLPEDLGKLESVSNNRSMGVADTACLMDVKTGKPFLQWGANIELGQPGAIIHANRANMRNFLAPHVNVQWNKKFVRYEEDESGVTAHFADGTSARGTMLVGVDGAGSLVRSQLLPGAKAQTLPHGVLVAEFTISPEDAAVLREDSTAIQIDVTDGKMLFIGLREAADDGAKSIYYHLYTTDQKAAEQGADYWTQTASKEEMHAKAMELTAGWKGSGKMVLDRSRVEDMMEPPFMVRQFSASALPLGRVTLMGDAAHAMPPFRGIGANTAMQDAIDLAHLFAQNADALRGDAPDIDIPKLFKEYERAMLPRGQALVAMSVRALVDDPTGEKMIVELKKRFGKE